MAPVGRDDEQHTSSDECSASDDGSGHGHFEDWDLSGDQPDTGEQDQQEADFGEFDARVVGERKNRNDGSCFEHSVQAEVSERSTDGRRTPRLI